MNNTENSTFKEIVEDKCFQIPAYQRAYAWTEKQIVPFISDLIENRKKETKYYLGHYILEREDSSESYQIIDGQQRITTIKIFMAVCKHFAPDQVNYSLNLDVADYDNIAFQNLMECGNIEECASTSISEETASIERVKNAIRIFLTSFNGGDERSRVPSLDKLQISAYIDVLFNAYSSYSVYSDKAVATQIFELHNTRGISLTEVEKVKAYLMKFIYSNSSDKESDIAIIQKSFGEIYKYEEIAAKYTFRGEMDLEEILMFHLRAVDDGDKKSSFGTPWAKTGENGCLSYLHKQINSKTQQEGVQYALDVVKEFEKTMRIVSVDFYNYDNSDSILGDIILLAKARSMVFLLKLFRSTDITAETGVDAEIFALFRNWEKFVFSYEFITQRGHFYNAKSNRGDFNSLIFKNIEDCTITQINNLIRTYFETKWFAYRLPVGVKDAALKYIAEESSEEIETNKWLNSRAYNSWNKLYYLLYKYELSINSSSRPALRKLFKENKISIDHIIARNITWKDCIGSEEPTDNEKDAWHNGVEPIINGIGNLVLLNVSKNSEASNNSPIDHYRVYEKLGLVSASYGMAKTLTFDNFTQWGVHINNRSNAIYDYLKKYLLEDMGEI